MMIEKKNFMNEEKKLEYRMYVLSLRHLSPINKACQGIHSSLEYANKYHDDPEYRKYIEVDKTLIMVDGGTHQDMVEIHRQFDEVGIKHSYFIEPDLSNCFTAITVIADERVWDKKYFQSYQEYYDYFIEFYENGIDSDGIEPNYEEWLEHIGGEKNAKLIEILSNKRLSQI